MNDYFKALIANCASKWRPVPGYEGIYEASTDGIVRSLTRLVSHPRLNKQTVIGRVLKQCARPNGYLCVQISRDGKQSPVSVHRLVASAHIGQIQNGMHVDHKNGVRTDNRLENLRIVTPRQNSRNSLAPQSANGNRGVSFCSHGRRKKRWRVTIRLGDKRHHVGNFLTLEEAVSARREAEVRYWGADAPSVVRS